MTVKKDAGTPQAKGAELLVAMTGKASPAKAAEGDKPVFAYIESLPEPQKSIAKHIDALAAKALPDLKRAVKWGMAYYGVPNGWCFTSGAFVGHLKLMFIRGNELQPEPPVTPIGMGKATRGVELTSMDELDEDQVLSWMAQAAEKPFVGGEIAPGGLTGHPNAARGRDDTGAADTDRSFAKLHRDEAGSTHRRPLFDDDPAKLGNAACNEQCSTLRKMRLNRCPLRVRQPIGLLALRHPVYLPESRNQPSASSAS